MLILHKKKEIFFFPRLDHCGIVSLLHDQWCCQGKRGSLGITYMHCAYCLFQCVRKTMQCGALITVKRKCRHRPKAIFINFLNYVRSTPVLQRFPLRCTLVVQISHRCRPMIQAQLCTVPKIFMKYEKNAWVWDPLLLIRD